MKQIEHEGAVQGSLGLLPERVALLGVFRGGVLDQVVNEPEHIRVFSDVAEGVVAVRAGQVHQVEHPQDVAPLQQQRPHRPDNLTFGVSHDVGGVSQHDIGLHQKTGLARPGAAYHDLKEVSSVLSSIQAHLQVLGQDHVPVRVLPVSVLPVQRPRVAPRGGAVFRAWTAVDLIGVVKGNGNAVQCQPAQQEFRRVGRPPDGKRSAQRLGKAVHPVKDSLTALIGIGGHDGQPQNRDGQHGPHRQGAFEVLLFHGNPLHRSSLSSGCPKLGQIRRQRGRGLTGRPLPAYKVTPTPGRRRWRPPAGPRAGTGRRPRRHRSGANCRPGGQSSPRSEPEPPSCLCWQSPTH